MRPNHIPQGSRSGNPGLCCATPSGQPFQYEQIFGTLAARMEFWAIRMEAASMLLAKVFQPFIERRPVCVMARGILERLFDARRIDALFAETADVGYTRKLHFSTLVSLMGNVVLGVHPSVHAAFQALEENDASVSLTAVYNKLDRIEPVVSAALVCDAAQQTAPVIDALGARLEPWLLGYRCRILDGHHLGGAAAGQDPGRPGSGADAGGRSVPDRGWSRAGTQLARCHVGERSRPGFVDCRSQLLYAQVSFRHRAAAGVLPDPAARHRQGKAGRAVAEDRTMPDGDGL